MRGARIAGILLFAAVAGFVAAQWLSSERAGPPAATSPGAAPQAAAPAPAAAPVAPLGELRIESGGRVTIDAASLPVGRPLQLRLDLGVPARDASPHPVRIAAVDGRVLELETPVGADQSEARLEIDPAFLTPGAYLVEVKTTEMSPFPLRRYVIEVR